MLANVQVENNPQYGLVVNSRVLAEEMGKRHDHVVRDLDKIKHNPNVGNAIIPTFYQIKEGGRSYRKYLLTKDGFTLYMFNIQGYIDFKMAYINKFNEMERLLCEPTYQPRKVPVNYNSMQKLTFGGHPVMTVAQFVGLFNLSKRTILDWTEKVCSKYSVKMLTGEPLARYGKENNIEFTGGKLFIYDEFESLNLANALKAPQEVIAFIKDYFKPTYNPNISEKDFKLALQQADLLYKIAKDIQDPYAKEQNLKAVTAILINIGLWTETHHGYNGITSEWSINSTEGWNKRVVMSNAKRLYLG